MVITLQCYNLYGKPRDVAEVDHKSGKCRWKRSYQGKQFITDLMLRLRWCLVVSCVHVYRTVKYDVSNRSVGTSAAKSRGKC